MVLLYFFVLVTSFAHPIMGGSSVLAYVLIALLLAINFKRAVKFVSPLIFVTPITLLAGFTGRCGYAILSPGFWIITILTIVYFISCMRLKNKKEAKVKPLPHNNYF